MIESDSIRTEVQFAAIIDSLPTALIMVDRQGKIVLVNAQAERLFGYAGAELRGELVDILVPRRFRGNHADLRTGFTRTPEARPMGAGRNLFGVRKDGREFPIEIGLSPMRTAQGLFVLSTIIDISERLQQAETLRQAHVSLALNEALQESCDYAEAIIETAPTPLVVLDGSLRVMKANRAFYECFETRVEETEGKLIYELGDRQWDIAALCKLLEEILLSSGQFRNYAVRHAFPALGERIMLLSARRLAGGKSRPEMILLSIDDATERARAEDELRAVGRRKDEFLAMLAHELRNPLAPMRLAAETIRATASADPAVTLGAAVVGRQVAHLSRLVDDLVDVARIKRGMIAIRKSRIVLDEVIEAALELSKPSIEEREHHLIVNRAPLPIYLDGDMDRLAQIVSNLLNNAAKFTPKGGEITLSTLVKDGHALIKVRDNGSGIPAELLPHVFDLFFQADASQARGYAGMGIGLSLSRHLVELHGGSIKAKSGGTGKGSEFVVRLPLHEVAASPAQIVKPATTEGAKTATYRVLVVDDNVDAAKMTQMFLQTHGHEVRCAFDGLSALGLAQEFKPDLVLLDISMPGMDGYEVLSRMRGQAGTAPPVVAALTGYESEAGMERMKQLGLDHYLVKPVAPEALLALIASLG